MEKKYLTEENYERAKKKVMRLALIIFLVGLLVGGGLIAFGVVKSNENNQKANQIREENKSKTRTESEVQADITNVQNQINTLQTEINSLTAEYKIAEVNAKQTEMFNLRQKLSGYEQELFDIKTGGNDVKTNVDIAFNTDSFSSTLFYGIGGFIIVASSMISIAVYIFGKRREIAAFTAQQVMPVAQEGIETMAPTIGNAAGEIAKGIKKGLNDVPTQNTNNNLNDDTTQNTNNDNLNE